MTDKTPGACQCHEKHAPTYWKSVVREYKDALEKAGPRPLTPDAITDEMVKRARVAWLGANINLTPDGFVREILTAALTEPPKRPEGAERWEDFLIDSLDYQALTDQQITDLADRIAKHGVRVVTEEQS